MKLVTPLPLLWRSAVLPLAVMQPLQRVLEKRPDGIPIRNTVAVAHVATAFSAKVAETFPAAR
jgi:hypothetical protein